MRLKIRNGKLVIELLLEKPRPSATGKTLLIATTHGVKRSTEVYKGQTISFVANAFIYPNGKASEAANDEEDD